MKVTFSLGISESKFAPLHNIKKSVYDFKSPFVDLLEYISTSLPFYLTRMTDRFLFTPSVKTQRYDQKTPLFVPISEPESWRKPVSTSPLTGI